MMKFILIAISLIFAVSCSHYGKRGGHHHKKMWHMMDADNNGEVTKAEFDKAQGEMFSKMDANGDGKITKEEKKAHWKAMKGKMGACTSCNDGDKKNCKDCGHSKEDCKKGGCKM